MKIEFSIADTISQMMREKPYYKTEDKAICYISGEEASRIYCGKPVSERIFWNLRGLREQKLSKWEEKRYKKYGKGKNTHPEYGFFYKNVYEQKEN